MTNKYKLKCLWAVICALFLVFAIYSYLHRTNDLLGSLVGFGCVIIFLIMITFLVFKQIHNTDRAKDLMIQSMSKRFHIDPKHIMVVDRIAYIELPSKKIMIKMNLVNFHKKIIHENY